MRGWKVDDGDGGWQDDDTLTFNGKKENSNFYKTNLKCSEFSISLPEKVTVVSRGPAAESQPGALGVFSKLPYVRVWENICNRNFKLIYDGNHIE